MDTDELIDRLNTLQAQNIALMQIVAALIRNTGADISNEYQARCAIFRTITEPGMDADAISIQRAEFARIGRSTGAIK